MVMQGIALQTSYYVPPTMRSDFDDDDIRRPVRIAVATNLGWDETEHVVSLGIDPTLTNRQQRCAWHIMVSTQRIIVTIVPRDNNAPLTTDSIDVVRPPVPVSQTSSSAIFNGLYEVPGVLPQTKAVRHLTDAADICTTSFHRDGAAPNRKMIAHVARLPASLKGLFSDFVCQLHTLKLTDGLLSKIAGPML
jgi:hypothetical protein